VAAIIGLMTVMALPSFMKSRRQSKIRVMVNEFRVIHDALNMYAMDNNGFPTGFILENVPQPVSTYLAHARWQRPTALGGRWLYAEIWNTHLLVIDDFNVDPGKSPLAPIADWLEIDQAIDDGDLSTGGFRLVGNVQIQYSVDNDSSFPNVIN
jgi:hypothetical protein